MTGCFSHFLKTFIVLVNGIIFIAGIVIFLGANTAYNMGFGRYYGLIEQQTIFPYLIYIFVFLIISTSIGFTLLCCNVKLFRYVYVCSVLVVLIVEIIALIAKPSVDTVFELIQNQWKQYLIWSPISGTWNWTSSPIREFARYIERTGCCFHSHPIPTNYTSPINYCNGPVTIDDCSAKTKTWVTEQLDSIVNVIYEFIGATVLLFLFAFTVACCYIPEDNPDDIPILIFLIKYLKEFLELSTNINLSFNQETNVPFISNDILWKTTL